MARAPQVRSVRNKEDRERPSVFMRLKTDEQFRGHALFEPDMAVADNPGFYEYWTHWDQQGKRYVPCAGDQCPFCRANNAPSTKASTLWYFPDNDKKDQLKVFTMNFSSIKDMTDISEEDDGVLGKKFRVKRMSDEGEYRIRPLAEKALTKTEIKALLKDAPDLEEMMNNTLKREWERMKAMDAMSDDDDDDDDDDDEPTSARRGQEDTDDDEDENGDEEEDEEEDEDEDDEEEEDEDEEDEEEDEDEEEAEDEEAEEEDEEEEADEEEAEDEISAAVFTVVKGNEDDENIDVKDKDGNKLTLFVGEGLEPNWTEIKRGATLTVDALKDDEGDYVLTALKVKKARATSTRSTGTTRSTRTGTRTRRTARK